MVESVPEGPDAERVLRDLAGMSKKLIFATSLAFRNTCKKRPLTCPK